MKKKCLMSLGKCESKSWDTSLNPLGWLCNQKDSQEQVLVQMWRNGTFIHGWWECKMVATLENSLQVLPKY